MKAALPRRHQWRNLLDSMLLIIAMSALLAISVNLLLGWGLWLSLVFVITLLLMKYSPLSDQWTLKAYQARYLTLQQAPELYHVVSVLADRAGMKQIPELYWIPSRVMNAFSVGGGQRSAIGITDAMFRELTQRELLGVLAHEISHIANQDTRLMALADLISRITHLMALTGGICFLLLFPFAVFGVIELSLGATFVLLLAPFISGLLQLKLSRTREFAADSDAVYLTGDPMGLALALKKIEHKERIGWKRLFLSGYGEPQPSLLRSHPAIDDRVHRLSNMQNTGNTECYDDQEEKTDHYDVHSQSHHSDTHQNVLADKLRHKKPPRHHLFWGIWH